MSDQNKEKKLFSAFPPSSKQDWTEKAVSDLRGADFEKKLVWKHLSGLKLQPYYTREDAKETLSNTGLNKAEVINYRRIPADATEKNTLVLQAIEEGMTGVILELHKGADISEILKGIDLSSISIGIEFEDFEASLLEDLRNCLSVGNAEKKEINGYVQFPIWKALLSEGNFSPQHLDSMYEASVILAEFPGLKTVAINGTAFIDAGGSQVQEIAYMLNALVWVAEEMLNRGLKAQDVFDNLHIVAGIGSEYFVEIAKLRAMNSLMHLVAEKFGVDQFDARLMPKTSVWTKSVTDANTNMLRSTTEAMSAILGNADALEIDPYDANFPEQKDFSHRIAGNIVTILKEESYFGKVANPTDGAYYIEELTRELAQKSLELFKRTEEAGGFYQEFKTGSIPSAIAEIRQKKVRLLSQRRLSMVGVNKYPNLMEQVKVDVLQKKTPLNNEGLLVPRRAGLEVEIIRYRTEELTSERGSRPKVALITFGNLAMRKARATFAFDFLGVGGYEIEEEKSYETALEGAQESAASDADIIVICSSDDDYREQALSFIRTFRASDSKKVLLLAGNLPDLESELTDAGLDGSIHLRADIFDSLTAIHEKLSRTAKSMEL